MSNQAMKELEGEIGSASQAPDNQPVARAMARASDLPLLDVSGADSPRSRIGRGLESIGGLTADTFQRLSTAVGGVVKSPVVLMAKVGGLASPRAATLTAPPGSSLEERVLHLEIQMKRFEEKFSSRTVVTELDLSPCSHKKKPQMSKSPLQEMETEGTLVKRVQMLEDRLNERMERIEEALSSIQSQLDHAEFSRHEIVVGYERQESLSGEPQYYDAEQQSDNFEALEDLKHNFFDAHDVSGDVIGGSPILEKSHVKETSSVAPTTAEHVEPLQEIYTGKIDDYLEPQVVSTSVYPKEAILAQSVKPATPSSELAETVHGDDAGNLIASSDLQLASTLEELHGSFVTESSAATASAKFLEIARADIAKKSTLPQASSKPQPVFVLEEHQEAFLEEPSTAILVAKFGDHAREDVVDKSGTAITATESPSPNIFEAILKNFVKEPLVRTPNAKPSQELTTQGDDAIALASSEPRVTSMFVEEPSVAVPSANFEELAKEDTSDKSVTMSAIGESPNAFAFQDPQEDSMKESLASAPIAGPIHEPSSQEDLNTTSDMALASSQSSMASKSMEDPSTTILGTNFEEPIQEDSVEKSGNMLAATELPLVSLLEEPHEESVKKLMAIAPSVECAQVLATQESNDIQVAAPELQRTSKFVEEPSAVAPSADPEEPAQEDVAKKIGTTMATTKLSLASSLEEPNGGFEKESMAFAPSAGLAHETSSLEHLGATSDVALASSKLAWESKFVEEPLPNILSANSEEPVEEDGATKIDTMIIGVKSPLFEEPQEDFDKESLATISGIELAQELATQEEIEEEFVKESLVAPPNVGLAQNFLSQEDLDATSDMAFASSTRHLASKFVEKPSLDISSANSKDHVQDKDVKSDTMSATADSLLASSFEEPHEDFEKESLATASSHKPTQGLATKEDSHMVPTSFESQEASKSMEEPSTITPSANFEELAHEDAVDESVALTTAGVSPFTSTFEETQEYREDYTEESSTAGASAKVLEPIEDDESGKSPIAFAPLEAPSSSMPQEAFLEEPSRTSIQPVQEKSGIILPDVESTLSWTVEEGNQATKEAEYNLAEDFKVHDEVGFDELKPESLVAKDNDQSNEEFFDAEHGSGNFEPWESVDPKSFKEISVAPNEPSESTGINVVAEKETVEPTSSMEPEQAHVREFAQEPKQALARELERDHKSVERAPIEEPEQQSTQEQGQQPTQELEEEDLIRNSAVALPPSEPQETSESRESQELLAEEPLATVPSIKFEETAQANVADKSGTHDLPLTSTTKEPQIDTVVSLGKSLSSASFHQSSNLELLENLEYKSLDTPSICSTPQEVLERESLTTTPTTEIAHGHDFGKSDNVHILSKPQLEESREVLVNEPVEVVQNSESTKPAQEVDDGRSGATLTSLEPQLTPTLEELHEGFKKELVADVESTSKSVNLEESLPDEPSGVTTSTKLAQESTIDKISVGLVEEPPLTSIAKETQNGSVDSLVEGKHGQDEVDQKFLEDVKIIAESIEEAISRTQSDLTHVKLKSNAAEDATKFQSQGSFLAFGATSVDSKEAIVKEPLPSAKLLELFEEVNNFGPILADSPATSTVEEPQKPLVEEPLAGAKLIPKGHARRRGFARSSSEPQFVYKLEEHRKARPKESSVVVDPSASKLGKKHAQEDFADTQCLPFRILGEGKHPRKESEFNLMEDVKSPVTKSETASSYVLEPKPSKIKEKKKKEKKPDAIAEEKERRLSLGLGEMERKSSLRAEEKDDKYLPRAEEKPKQPFRHLRDRLRHAFSVNKEP